MAVSKGSLLDRALLTNDSADEMSVEDDVVKKTLQPSKREGELPSSLTKHVRGRGRVRFNDEQALQYFEKFV